MSVRCLLCPNLTREDLAFCPACARDFANGLETRLGVDAQNLSAGLYLGSYARWIKLLKSQPGGQMSTLLERTLFDIVDHWLSELPDFDFVVPVPGHPFRVRIETDLATDTARRIAGRSGGRPCAEGLLRRTWFASAQKLKKRSARLAVGANEFRLASGLAQGLRRERRRRALLVDDVRATGSTLARCRHLLEAAQFEIAGTFVLARVPGPPLAAPRLPLIASPP